MRLSQLFYPFGFLECIARTAILDNKVPSSQETLLYFCVLTVLLATCASTRQTHLQLSPDTHFRVLPFLVKYYPSSHTQIFANISFPLVPWLSFHLAYALPWLKVTPSSEEKGMLHDIT